MRVWLLQAKAGEGGGALEAPLRQWAARPENAAWRVEVRAAGLRQRAGQALLEQLQQRLNDRILIERAKGVLVQRLGISEEEAYKRLRVLSRRQRRQIRDIAQSLLDAQALLTPESPGNGFIGNGHPHAEEAEHERQAGT